MVEGLKKPGLERGAAREEGMLSQRSPQICGLALFCALALVGCGAVEQAKLSIFPTPTPLPTPTAQPYVGHVGQRTAYTAGR